MGIDAVVVLACPAADAEPFFARPLADGCLVWTGVRFTRDAAAASRALRATLGALLDHADDPAGAFVFPDVAEPRGRTRAEVEAELADVGYRVPTTPPPADDAIGVLQDRVGLPVIAALQRALRSGDPDATLAASTAFEQAVAAVPEDELAALLARALRPHEPDDA